MSRLEDYAQRYQDTFVLEREHGILLARMHTDGAESLYSPGEHSCWGWAHLFREIAEDPDNEVVIITGTGEAWMRAATRPHTGLGEQRTEQEKREQPSLSRLESPDVMYSLFDSHMQMMGNLLQITVPTIAAINGPAPTHSEHALACDITLCTPDTYLRDPHSVLGLVPGDGLGMSFQELMGTKRAAFHLYTGDAIDAASALAWGMVNEIVPRDQLLGRAFQIAERILEVPRLTRRMTTQIIRRPWQRRLTEDLSFQCVAEQFAVALDARAAGPEATARRYALMGERWQSTLDGKSTYDDAPERGQ